jgi:hypothetical protein
LFNEAPKVLVERIELVVRLAAQRRRRLLQTQTRWIPDSVLAQLQLDQYRAARLHPARPKPSRPQHKPCAKSRLDIETAITELAVVRR